MKTGLFQPQPQKPTMKPDPSSQSLNQPSTSFNPGSTNKFRQQEIAEANWVPPDGGWAWICVFACFLTFALVVGAGRVFGVIYKDVEEAFPDSKHMEIAMIPSVINALTVGLGVVAGALTIAYSCRSVAFVGGLFSGTGFCLSFFSMNATFMMMMFFISGIGAGLACTPGLLVVSKCFRKHRVTAVGFSLAGTAVGSMVLPHFLRFLADEYGFRGALLIQGGITYHVCAGALLYREPRMKTRKHRRASLSRPPIKVSAPSYIHWASAMTHVPQSESASLEGVESVDQLPLIDKKLFMEKGPLPLPPSPPPQSVPPGIRELTSRISMIKIVKKERVEKVEGRYSLAPVRRSNRCFMWAEKYLYVDLALFYNPVFVVLFFATTTLSCCYPQSLFFIPRYALELGYEPDVASMLISISAVGDLIGRLGSGWVFDQQIIPKHTGYIICSLVVSLSIIGTVINTNYVWLSACVFLHGWAAGSCFILVPVLLSEYHGTVKLASSFGIVRSGQGLVALMSPAVAGHLRDETGRFEPSLLLLGVLGIIAPLSMCLLIPVKSKYRHRLGSRWPPHQPNN